MRATNVPAIDGRFWLAILLASVCGTNAGDLYAHDSGLGLGAGLAVLGGLAALVFAAERAVKAPSVMWYWLLILIIRTGATNIADALAWGAHVPVGWLLAGLAVLIALGAARGAAAPAGGAAMATGLPYWLAMLGAGVFGTVAGDVAQHAIGKGAAAVLLGGAFLAAVVWARGRGAGIMAYWLVVCIGRTAGTAMGDWLAETRALHLGLAIATPLSLSAFVAAAAFAASAPSMNRKPAKS